MAALRQLGLPGCSLAARCVGRPPGVLVRQRVGELEAIHNLGGDSDLAAECEQIIERHLDRPPTPAEVALILPWARRFRRLMSNRVSRPHRWQRGEQVRILPTGSHATVVAVGHRNALVTDDRGAVRRVAIPQLRAA